LPAINIGLSVSRIGSAAQVKVMKQVAGSLKLQLAQFREVESFLTFSQDIDSTTMQTLERGLRLVEILKQDRFSPLSITQQVLLLFAALQGYLDKINLERVKIVKKTLTKAGTPDGRIVIDANKNVDINELKKIVVNLVSK
jgi:F-type H+-transporting ATPase subunit alpha